MPVEIKHHLQKIAEERSPLWIDAWAYGQQLLNRGNHPPWDDVGAFVSFYGRLQGLVKSDILALEIGNFYACWLRQNPALLATMGEKRRLGYALRSMLADPAARAQLHEVIKAVCDSNPDVPVLLALPSPKQWMASAHCHARQLDKAEVSWDDAESASMYVADFLRCFADCELSGVLLRDAEDAGPAGDGDVARYQPVINVANHYHWQLILDGCADDFLPAPDSGVSFTLGKPGSEAWGLKLPAKCWESAEVPETNGLGLRYLTVPQDAVPEQVLEIIGKARTGQRG